MGRVKESELAGARVPDDLGKLPCGAPTAYFQTYKRE